MLDDEGLWYGTTVGSTRSEGAAPASDWAGWERAGRARPMTVSSDLAESFGRDVRLLAESRLRTLRLTLEWAAIEPENGKIDQAAIERYLVLLGEAKSAGIRIIAGLHERSLPAWFSIDERAYRDERSLGYLWPRHVERCGEFFSHLVDGWIPIVEPVGWAAAGHLAGWAPPGHRHLRRFREQLVGAHRAGVIAAEILRGAGVVLSCFDVVDVRATPGDPEATAAAARVDATWWAWIDGFRDGVLHLPELGTVAVPAHIRAYDGIGVRILGTVTVDANGSLAPQESDEGTERSLARVLTDAPGRPVVVVGGGRPLEVEQGPGYESLAAELDVVGTAAAPNAVVGYLHDRAFDGPEWNGDPTPGTGLWTDERRPKAALDLF